MTQGRLENITQEKMSHSDDAWSLARLLESARSYVLATTSWAKENSGEGHRARRSAIWGSRCGRGLQEAPEVPRPAANMTRDRLSPLRVPTKLLDGVALVRTTAGEGGESDLL